ncbi:MAG: hypothetical protein JXI43_13105 [Tissierellales bacterium]|nr:hypothetical protein [Tissierellales bacterium]
MYDKRLETYPFAFEITDGLIGEYLFKPTVTREYLEDIRQRLMEWHRKKGIVLSDETIAAYAKLRRALGAVTRTDAPISKETLLPIWDAKNDFRTSMRKDLNLLYIEERNKGEK